MADPTADREALIWQPDSLPPVPTGVRIAASDSILLAWGARRPVTAAVTYSDGTQRSEAVEWASRDESVASVITTDSGAVLTANRPGQTAVVATAGGWHRDTVQVRVTDAGSGDALLRDRFASLDSARWLLTGWPTPVPVERDGEPVLLLRSDGLYSDGMVSRQGFALPRGGTLEVEFRMPVTRPASQSIGIGLLSLDRAPQSEEDVRAASSGGEVAFGYPYGEGMKFRADRASLGNEVLDVSGTFPTDGWTHVALQVRADGAVSLYLNREHAADWPLRLNNGPGTRWYVRVEATVQGTEALLRNLVLYPGMRYD
jgi:hypothetical protein